MKKIIIFLFPITWGLTGFSQSSLYISAGTNVVISPNTKVFADSLLIKPSSTFTISGANSVTNDATAIPPPVPSYINRVYHFLQTTTPFSGDIAIYYRDAELNGLTENSLNMSIYTGSAWVSYTPSSRDAVNNVVTRTGLTAVNLNEITLTAPGVVVPVSLYRFTGESRGCTALLKWSTASEQNSKHFEILQSTDGSNFSVIKIIPASVNSSTLKDYSYIASLTGKENYFRLRMVDLDGESKFSNVLSITGDCDQNIISVFPNPTNNSITITGLTGSNQLKIIDGAGRVLSSTSTGNISETINLSAFAAGNYIVQVVQNNKIIKNIKIIKE